MSSTTDPRPISVAQIKAEAIKAAAKYNTTLEACPYPKNTCESLIFKHHFNAERYRITREALNDPAIDDALQTQISKSIKAGLDSIMPTDDSATV